MNSSPTNTCPHHLVVKIHFLYTSKSETLRWWMDTSQLGIWMWLEAKNSIPLTLNYDSLRNRTLDFIPSSSSTSYCESLGHPPTHLMSFSERLPLVGRLSQMMMSIHISSMNVDIYHSGLLVRLSFIAQPKKPNDRHPKETEGKKVVGLTDCPNDAHSQLRPEREKGISPVTFVKSISGVRMWIVAAVQDIIII